METSRKPRLNELLDTSRRRARLAEDGDWEAVACLQDQLHQSLQQFFATSVTASEAPLVKAAITEMLELDTQIASLGTIARDGNLKEASTLTKGRRALREYSANSG